MLKFFKEVKRVYTMKYCDEKNKVIDGKWKHDSDIPLKIWNGYLKKYGNKYQILRDEIGIWHIKCKPKNNNSKYNAIQTYSIVKKQLCFVGEFKTKNKKTFFKKKLNNYCEIVREGDLDIVVKFDEKYLDALSTIFDCYRRRKYSDEYCMVLRERVNKARKIKDNKKMNEAPLIYS